MNIKAWLQNKVLLVATSVSLFSVVLLLGSLLYAVIPLLNFTHLVDIILWLTLLFMLISTWLAMVESGNNPLLGMLMVRSLTVAFICLRFFLFLASLLSLYVWFVGPELLLYNFYLGLADFGAGGLPLTLLEDNFQINTTITDTLHTLTGSVIGYLIPTVYAQEHDITDPSFNSILSDNSPGGLLISNYIQHIHSQNSLGINLSLTKHGLTHTKSLVDMLNKLHTIPNSTQFTGDHILFDFLQSHYNSKYNFNVDSSSTLNPIESYALPLSRQVLSIDGMSSGVYAFTSNISNDCYIGSALSFRSRLISHMASFNGNDTQTYLHTWAAKNGGITSLNWAPLVDMPNITLQWSKQHPTLVLSKGGYNTLTAFSQLPIRMLEQAMFDHYSPTLHQSNGIITFFNVKLNPLHFSKPVQFKTIYQAVDLTRSTVLAQEHSMNKLAAVVGLSELSIRNNMNWHLPTKLVVDGVITDGYILEVGAPIRTVPVVGQLKPAQKNMPIQLVGRTLYDLIPGKIHVVDMKTLQDVYLFDSEKDLWLTLNPSRVPEYEQLNTRQQYQYLGSRVSIYVNTLRNEGNKTELGNFLFCRHPDILTKFKVLATPFFAVALSTGICTWYENNQKVPGHSSSTVLRNRNKNKTTHSGLRFVNADLFVKEYPAAVNAPGSTYKLTPEELTRLPLNPPHKVQSSS